MACRRTLGAPQNSLAMGISARDGPTVSDVHSHFVLASSSWLGLPSRRPRLTETAAHFHRKIRWGALGLIVVLAASAVAAAGTFETQDPAALQLVALLLYGQPDPANITAAGLHGLGGRVVPVGLTQTGRCRFTVATATQSEDIDFEQVEAIHFLDMPNPAAGIANLSAPRLSPRLQRLAVAVLEGSGGAFCNDTGCLSKRVFALRDPEHLGEARAAAAAFQARFCHRRSGAFDAVKSPGAG